MPRSYGASCWRLISTPKVDGVNSLSRSFLALKARVRPRHVGGVGSSFSPGDKEGSNGYPVRSSWS
ncbi:hypothetical protein BDQ94DRAFT_138607 [Aspergillus welwitschiae]|uniref:Uncharacterized protein n=1 Tax=Aspergillus welwitschiae TaxID=1341132 RepID=A0A3F3QBI4_9EURO|nr:hypothetical protein BDQ94DRAFT_138607 [Aspergillus welwitschiae]RDH36122.1 hypothetical protein BDQ94DRAFT_138607 [Aspergillus welwitschiae]